MRDVKQSKRQRSASLAAWLVLVITLGGGLWFWRINVEQHAHTRAVNFNIERERLRSAIASRLSQYVDHLHAARGFFLASHAVSRQEWRTFIQGLVAESRFPDVHAITFVPHIAVDADNDVRAPVAFAEHTIDGDGLVGFDLMTHPALAAALEEARSTDRLTVTGRITDLPGTAGDAPAIAIIVPIRRDTNPTPDGWAVSFIHLEMLIDSIRRETMSDLGVTLVDTRQNDVLYHYPDRRPTDPQHNDALYAEADLPMAGGRWRLQMTAMPWTAVDANRLEPTYVLLGVVLVSLMLYAMLITIGRTRLAAVDLAQQMTFALRSSEAEARQLATTDQLTGLPNRSQLIIDLQRAIDRTRQGSPYAFAVLFLDLDRFKFVNDSLGHNVGDKLLIEVAERLRRCIRTGEAATRPGCEDVIARLGGDEFIVLLDSINDVNDATHIAQRIIREISTAYHIDGHDISTSVSVGIAASNFDYTAPEDVIRDADAAMYEAKNSGKARYMVFNRAMHEAAVNRLRLEADLRNAVRRHEFTLQYQPIIEVHNGRLHGFEALIRWNHPERGIIAPGEFIDIAEETGHVQQIGQWVLHHSCRQFRDWEHRFPEAAHLRLSVNLSRVQLRHPDIVNELTQIVEAHGLEPSRLRLEITEGVVMQDPEICIDTLDKLRNAGFELMMDDFGTGYSSLSLLHRLPFHGIKLDKSFVGAMNSRHHIAVVQTIVALAQNLDMHVTAEGVETRDQMTQLLDLSCDLVQGYFFARPQSPEEAARFIKRVKVTDPDLKIVA